MILIVLELQNLLIYITKNTTNKEYKRYILSGTEFDELNELKTIFEVFKKPTIALQSQKYITLGFSLLYIYQIYNKLSELVVLFVEKAKKIK
jgi:hypothetical protein